MKNFTGMLLAASLALPLLWSQSGAELFEKNCAGCHQAGSPTHAPAPEALRQMPRSRIFEALTTGKMILVAGALPVMQRMAIANYLGAKEPEEASGGKCASAPVPLKDLRGWSGWSTDPENSRAVGAAAAGLDRARVSRLKLKWAFGFPGATSAYGQPAVAGGRLFVGSAAGTVYALDAKTGCTYWTFATGQTVRTAISLAPYAKGGYALYFGDAHSTAYALDADTGALLWKTRVDEHPFSHITGSPMLFEGRLYVPVSTGAEEFVAAGDPKYHCCTARGSLVALDARDGERLWKTYTVPEPKPTRVNSAGTQMMGPSGVSIWSAPTVDAKRKVLYVGTGNEHSGPETNHSDAVLAIEIGTGKVLWSKQLTPADHWNVGCVLPNQANCPEKPGEDTDIGSSPILVSLKDGQRLLLVGQKSGVMWALDPDAEGKVVWQTRIGKGGVLGGIMFGPAADAQNVYVPLSDYTILGPTQGGDPNIGGGMFALRIATGQKVWTAPAEKPKCIGTLGCTPAQMAAATLIPGVVFNGSMDGHLRAYDTSDGKVIWDFDTLPGFTTVNGVKAHGGSMSASGAVVTGGMLYVNAGYGALGGMPGNVLLAFSAE
ncbi:MAG TPA: PQQ-binding-like beta-propeller repeat protein [Bryobacteraceae bacterium]|nr:PQQ-binding-like beta-propeller repeat protein [Bryobacteraceae bacterium]